MLSKWTATAPIFFVNIPLIPWTILLSQHISVKLLLAMNKVEGRNLRLIKVLKISDDWGLTSSTFTPAFCAQGTPRKEWEEGKSLRTETGCEMLSVKHNTALFLRSSQQVQCLHWVCPDWSYQQSVRIRRGYWAPYLPVELLANDTKLESSVVYPLKGPLGSNVYSKTRSHSQIS